MIIINLIIIYLVCSYRTEYIDKRLLLNLHVHSATFTFGELQTLKQRTMYIYNDILL